MNSSDKQAFGVKKSDFMKNSSFNFLENEKYYISGLQDAHKTCNQTEVEVQKQDVQTSSPPNEEIFNSQKVLMDEKIEQSGLHYPKTYTTKCYFKPKQNPVSYSETMIVNLGSNKKQYFDTVIYETKLIPFRWVETVRTVVPCLNENVFQSQQEVFVQGSDHHYMSLEPQQIAAITQEIVDQVEVH